MPIKNLAKPTKNLLEPIKKFKLATNNIFINLSSNTTVQLEQCCCSQHYLSDRHHDYQQRKIVISETVLKNANNTKKRYQLSWVINSTITSIIFIMIMVMIMIIMIITVMVFEELDVAGFIVIVLFRARLDSGTSRACNFLLSSTSCS